MEETMDFEYEEDFEEDNDNENGEEEDVVVDDEDDVYVFRFKSGGNPLALTENNASGLHIYQQFEHLEYEALASRKREAIASTRICGFERVHGGHQLRWFSSKIKEAY